MKNLKKVLALVLAFACAFTMFAGAAFTDESDIQAKDAVNMLTALGVIEGDPDGSFRPDATVTRAEMAKMIFVVRNNSIDDSAYANTASKLTDINNHWAKGYIKFCESQGIIAGYGDGTFKPDATVTGTEAAKMLLVLAGYEPSKAGLEGHNWATNTLRFAGAAGILDDVASGLESGLPRQYAAQMIYNALSTDRVKWSTDSESFDNILNGGVKETVGKAYMGLYNSVGTLVDVDRDTIALANIDGAESDAISSKTVNGNVQYTYGTDFTKVGTDYSKLLGQKVKVMFKSGKTNDVLGVYALSDNTAYTVNANEVSQDGAKVKFGGKSYSLKTDAIDHNNSSNTVTVNDAVKVYITEFDGDKVTYVKDNDVKTSAYFNDLDQSSDVMTFIDSDADGKLDTVIVTDYTAAKVTYASSSQIVAGGETYKFADEKIDENIAKDDWAVISYDRYNDCKTIAKDDMITGKLTATKEGTLSTKVKFDQYQIDDTWYNAANDGTNTDLKTVKAGDSVEAVAVNGVLYYVKRTSAGTDGEISDVALLLGTDTVVGTKKASIALFDGSKKTVDIDSDTKVTLTPGTVYEYSVSGNEYTFTTLNTADKEYYSDFTAYTSGITDVKNQKNDKITISGTDYKIADNAKVLLYADGDRKYITGKQFKNLTLDNDANTKATAVFVGDMDGLTRVGALAVSVKALPDNLDTNDNYAYILDDAVNSGNVNSGNNQISYPIWTGSEMITVTENYSGSLSNRQAGLVIGYKSINTENSNEISDVSLKKMNVAKIDSKSDNDKTLNVVKMDGTSFADNSGSVFGEHDIADATVIYVNSDNDYDAKAEGGNIGIMNGSPITSDYASALFLLNGDDFEVIVIDVKGKFVGNPYVVDTAAQRLTASGDIASTMTTDYQTQLSKTGTLTVNNVISDTAATSVDVKVYKDGNSTAMTSSELSSAGITATAADIAAKGKTSSVSIQTTASTTAEGSYKVVFTVDGVQTSVTFTVTPKAIASLSAIDATDSTTTFSADGEVKYGASTTLATIVGKLPTTKIDSAVTPAFTIKVDGRNVADTYVPQVGETLIVTATFTVDEHYAIADSTAAPTVASTAADANSFVKNANGTWTATYTFTVVA